MNRRPERYAGWHSMLVWPRTSSDWCRGFAIECLALMPFGVYFNNLWPNGHHFAFPRCQHGQAIKGIGVSVIRSGTKPRADKSHRLLSVIKIDQNRQIVATDREGRGAFYRLYYEPALITLYILFHRSPEGATSTRRFSIEEVRRTGAVASYEPGKENLNGCGQLKAHATAKPGELVIFDKRLTALGSDASGDSLRELRRQPAKSREVLSELAALPPFSLYPLLWNPHPERSPRLCIGGRFRRARVRSVRGPGLQCLA